MPNDNKLYKVWDKNADYILSEDSYKTEKSLAEIVGEIFCPGPFYYYIIDFKTRKLEHVSGSIEKILNLNPETAQLTDIIEIVHPEDMHYVQIAEEYNLKKMKENNFHFFNTKMAYCFKEKTADGNYKLFQLQALQIEVDQENETCKILNIHTDISGITDVNNYKLTLMGVNGNDYFLQYDLKEKVEIKKSERLFSVRESEIIKLITDGLDARLISEKLFISPNTLKTHRKNIFRKAEVNSTAQLIHYCIKHGLL